MRSYNRLTYKTIQKMIRKNQDGDKTKKGHEPGVHMNDRADFMTLMFVSLSVTAYRH